MLIPLSYLSLVPESSAVVGRRAAKATILQQKDIVPSCLALMMKIDRRCDIHPIVLQFGTFQHDVILVQSNAQ